MISRIRLTPCGCEKAKYRMLPRKWWMRLFVGHHRYRCDKCHATMLLREKRMGWQQFLAVALAIALTVWASIWFVGYMEESREAAWKRSVTD